MALSKLGVVNEVSGINIGIWHAFALTTFETWDVLWARKALAWWTVESFFADARESGIRVFF